MVLTIDKTHELKGNGYLLGVDGENGSEQLIIKIENETLLDKWAYIEFEKDNGEKFTTERLSVVGGQIVYDIPNGLLLQCHLKVQVIFRNADGFVWKSLIRQYAVDGAINAGDNLPIEHPDFIGEAQKLLDEISVESDKVDGIIETEAERAKNEATRQENETARETAEEERKTAETARKTAETERQSNEASRVSAEQTRTAQFSAWSNYEGDAPEIMANLEAVAEGKLFDSVLDKTTAYTKATPSGSLPYAKLLKVGGMSYKADNALIDTPVKSVNNFLIPEAVQALDGYGLGIDETCFNYIDFERKVFVKRVGVADLGSLNWSYIASRGYFRTEDLKDIIQASTDNASNANLLCLKYEKTPFTNVYYNVERFGSVYDKVVAVQATPADSYGGVAVINKDYTDASTFKTAMSGVKLYYELSEPIETDISQYINKSYIPANGSVVFENDNGQAVPSEITFFVKK